MQRYLPILPLIFLGCSHERDKPKVTSAAEGMGLRHVSLSRGKTGTNFWAATPPLSNGRAYSIGGAYMNDGFKRFTAPALNSGEKPEDSRNRPELATAVYGISNPHKTRLSDNLSAADYENSCEYFDNLAEAGR